MMKFFFITSVFCWVTLGATAQWQATGALAASGSATYLTAATSVGDNVYVVSNEQYFAYSSDNGTTWTVPTITKPNGTFALLKGAGNRLYASMKINTYDYELLYSLDHGSTWVMDTVGLPKNLTKTGKASMKIEYMGNNYVMAFNSSKAYYKQLGGASWLPTTIDNVILDIAPLENKWLAIGIQKIMESTDNGQSWTSITTSGLPESFQGNLLCTNRKDRAFMSNAPADGGEDIYFSEDGGTTWSLTNSGGKFSYANPWVNELFALGDCVFASIRPEFANFTDAPPYLISTTSNPNFTVGDVSGFPTGKTNTALPFFFESGGKVFTMFWDLYVTDPNKNTIITAGEMQKETELTVAPNPFNDTFTISARSGHWSIYKTNGLLVKEGEISNQLINVEGLTSGTYVLKVTSTHGSAVFKLMKQ